MSYRASQTMILGVFVLVAAVSSAVHADMNGNVFTSRSHSVSISRPDASWELREHPAQNHAVALFSNGEGRVIALLAHRVIERSDAIASPGKLRTRWPELAREIVDMTNTGEQGLAMDASHYEAEELGVTFDITYTNRSPALGANLKNWISGLMVRGADNRQHIYAIRCAAPAGVYDAWESQFALIMPTLRFEGHRQIPFYTNAPIPRWWFAVGAAVLVIVVVFFRRSRDSQRVVTTPDRLDTARVPSPPRVAPHADAPLKPEHEESPVPNHPDQVLVAADLSDVPDQEFHQAAAEDRTYGENPSAAPAGFWKCDCGRVNSNNESFCVRCNADRVTA